MATEKTGEVFLLVSLVSSKGFKGTDADTQQPGVPVASAAAGFDVGGGTN